MIVKIGHAADTDRGLIISNWYNKPWTFVLRPKRREMAEKMVTACRQIIESGKVRYSQQYRNSLWRALKSAEFDTKRLSGVSYADCSSLMAVCAKLGGCALNLDGVNAPTTRTMKERFMATGDFDLLTDAKFTHSSDYLKAGDVLDVPNSHTVMVLNDGLLTWPDFRVGDVYTTQVNLKVRTGPSIGAAQKLYDDLSEDGKKHAFMQRKAVFKAGTKVTCKEVREEGVRTWLRCPSGWLCGLEDGSVYIK